MKFEIKHRWTGAVIFTAEIEASDETAFSIKLGLAVRKAIEAEANLSKANLSGANLSKANLSEADLSEANLSWANLSEADLSEANLSWADLSWANLSEANLSGANLSKADLSKADLSEANLSGADLSKANLRAFKSDIWMILTQNRVEVPALINALCDGRVDGSVYTGECACLMGTIANVRGVNVNSLECDSGRPAERWFMMISKGDKPGDNTGGGYASRLAVTWCLEWCALNGIESQPAWDDAVKVSAP